MNTFILITGAGLLDIGIQLATYGYFPVSLLMLIMVAFKKKRNVLMLFYGLIWFAVTTLLAGYKLLYLLPIVLVLLIVIRLLLKIVHGDHWLVRYVGVIGAYALYSYMLRFIPGIGAPSWTPEFFGGIVIMTALLNTFLSDR